MGMSSNADGNEKWPVAEGNIIVRAARAQREVWEAIEQQDAEIERLRALITAWADAGQAIGVTIGGTTDECDAYDDACSALRKAVRR